MKNRILLAGVLGCLMLAAIPGSALAASHITPEGPFTAVAGTTTLNIPEAKVPGSATAGVTVTCASSTLRGTVKNSSTENVNPITPGVPTFANCTSTGGFKPATITAPAPRNMVIAPSATVLYTLALTVSVGNCTMEFVGNQSAYYPTSSPVRTFTFENAHNVSVMTMTKPPTGIFCEVTFGSKQKAIFNAGYTLSPPLTVVVS